MTTGRKLALGAAAIAGFVVLALAGLHFYLKISASRYRAELVRRGERLRIEQVRPKFVSPNDNGAPLLQIAVEKLPHPTGAKGGPLSLETRAMFLLPSGQAIVGWRQPDLRHARASETNSWEELREEMDSLASTLDQVRSELRKPGFDFGLNYSQRATLPLLHLGPLYLGRQVLLSATLLHLHVGNLVAALADLHSQLDLVRVLENEPLEISQRVRAAQMRFALRATWEALQADAWNDTQLAELQSAWQALHFFEPFRNALLMQRAMNLNDFSELRDSDSRYLAFAGVGSRVPVNDPVEFIARTGKEASFGLDRTIWRTFWSHYDEPRYLALMQFRIEAFRQPNIGRAYYTEQRALRAAMARFGFPNELPNPEGSGARSFSLHRDFMEEATIELESNLSAFEAETERELVLSAIGLKRYQLRYGKTAPTLAALIPEFLPQIPRDYMDGSPLKFSLNPDGSYLLYSVGSDGKDDDGLVKLPGRRLSSSQSPEWPAGRDWVWPQPADHEAAEAYNAQTGGTIAKEFNREQKKAIRKPART